MQAPGIVYRCLDVEIDPTIPAVFREGREVELRAKGLLVLLFLVEQRQRVVSKEELLERAWPGTTVVDATLAGCIQEIRKALGDDAKAPRFIRTVSKLGYRFVAPVEEVQPAPEAAALPIREIAIEPERIPPAQTGPYGVIPVNQLKPELRRRAAAVAAVIGLAGAVWLFAVSGTGGVAADTEFDEVAWWKLDEAAGGAIANSARSAGLSGKATGGTWEQGVLGNGLRLDGQGQRVEGVDQRGTLPRGDSPRSVAVWAKVASANGDITGILHFGALGLNSRDSFRLLLLPDGRPSFAHKNYAGLGDDHSLAMGQQRIDDGEWHHIAGTFGSGRGTLFLDGVQQATATMVPESELPPDRQIRWVLGSTLPQHHSGFRGVLDDARIWRRALRPAEISALYRCTAGLPDVTTSGGTVYSYSPVWDITEPTSVIRFHTASSTGSDSTTILHAGVDYGGVQLIRRERDCAVASLRGADVGQDLSISVEVLVPTTSTGEALQAGPYFRSRSAAPGDGIMGGESAGYWVQLHSTGKVTVKCLNPAHTVAFSEPVASFDSSVFHKLEAAVQGETLEVALDGRRLSFDQAGKTTQLVQIPPDWERPNPIGRNRGAAGIGFSTEPMRPKAGGQQARRFTLQPYHPLSAL